jgi:hypothetical protein
MRFDDDRIFGLYSRLYDPGGLSRPTQGRLEFVEVYKAPITPEIIDLEAAWHPLVRDGPTCYR